MGTRPKRQEEEEELMVNRGRGAKALYMPFN